MEDRSRADFNAKLQTVAYMRASAEESRSRLENARQILSDQRYYMPPVQHFSDHTMSEQQKKEQSEPVLQIGTSFLLRLGLVLLILLFFYFGKQGPDGSIRRMLTSCQKEIAADHAENLFDFIAQIPYTFDYEKANAAGRDPVKN